MSRGRVTATVSGLSVDVVGHVGTLTKTQLIVLIKLATGRLKLELDP